MIFGLTLSCDRVFFLRQAKIIDTQGKTLAFGEPGELCIRGYVNCRGYWEEPEKTKELIDDEGWLKTG